MSYQYEKNNGNGKSSNRVINGNGKDILNYLIMKDIYKKHGQEVFNKKDDGLVIETVMKYTYSEEESKRAKEDGGEDYAIARFASKLGFAEQRKTILYILFDMIQNDSAKNGKSIDTLLEEKITGQFALF